MTTLQTRPDTTETAAAAVPSVSAGQVFRDAVASEWMKVRTLRSTYAFFIAGVGAFLLGMFILFMLIQSFDAAPPENQSNYETADPTVVVMPFVMFFIGAIGGMLITSEFTTRSIGPGLLAVPQRRTLLAAKATVVGAIGLFGGLLFALLSFSGATLLLGDRPAPLNPWPNPTDALPTVFCAAALVMITCIVTLGLGTVLRSTASTLTTLGGLVLVAPVFAHFLPTTWQLRFGSILLPNLTPQIVGANHPWMLSQAGAVAVAIGYAVVALGVAAFAFKRRDAS
ncbi:ABC transporter permease [Plantactinospora endophytica]